MYTAAEAALQNQAMLLPKRMSPLGYPWSPRGWTLARDLQGNPRLLLHPPHVFQVELRTNISVSAILRHWKDLDRVGGKLT